MPVIPKTGDKMPSASGKDFAKEIPDFIKDKKGSHATEIQKDKIMPTMYKGQDTSEQKSIYKK